MIQTKILIADDHAILRHGLIDMIESFEDMVVVAEAGDGKTLLEKYYEANPDIVITDIEMPKLRGTEAALTILKSNPIAKIIFLSMHNSDELLYKSMLIGASGFISKEIAKEGLINAIRVIVQGGKYFMGKTISEIDEIIKKFESVKNHSALERSIKLTNREKDVLLLMANGLTSYEIADNLGIGKRTVDSIRSDMMEKLNFDKSIQLLKYALEYSFQSRDLSGV